MKIVMFGAGGVGGYFGGRLAQAGCDVSFVARGAHLEAIRRDGLRIVSPKGDAHVRDVRASDDPAALGPADVVLFTVKLYDAERAAAQLAPLVGPDTMVVTLQNGVDAVDIVASHVGRQHTAGGVAYVAAVIDPPGTIKHTALDALIVGELDGAMSPRLMALADAAARAGFGFTASPHILVDLWSKFARLSVFSAMTAITRSPLGVLRAQPELMAMLERAAWETIAVGRAHGVELTDARDGRSAGDDARPAADGAVVDALGPRARPAARAPVAERRGRPPRARPRASRRRPTSSWPRCCCRSSRAARRRWPELR